MEAQTERSRLKSSSARRKPLSDTTNFVIPTSTILRKLSSSLSTSTHLPNPIQKPKPSSDSENSSVRKPENNPSKSNTSIGSSNHNSHAPKPSTACQPHLSTPPRVSATISGNGSGETDVSPAVYRRRQTTQKTKNRGNEGAGPCTPPFQVAKDNAKSDTLPVSSSPLQKRKDKEKGLSVRLTRSSVQKTKDKLKPDAVPSSIALLGKTKDTGKTVVPFSCPPKARARKRRNESNEAGSVGLSKSCTVPHPKHRKKKCCKFPDSDASADALPQDFVEQQRAYFREVDEFELPEEEVSECESDY